MRARRRRATMRELSKIGLRALMVGRSVGRSVQRACHADRDLHPVAAVPAHVAVLSAYVENTDDAVRTHATQPRAQSRGPGARIHRTRGAVESDRWSLRGRRLFRSHASRASRGHFDRGSRPSRAAAQTTMRTAHVAAAYIVSECKPGRTYQPCAFCGVRLVSVRTGGRRRLKPYATRKRVGQGCSRGGER
jgi:hypothetical protein